MKALLAVVSASATLCLIWPVVSLAEPQHGGGHPGGGGGHPGGGGGHPGGGGGGGGHVGGGFGGGHMQMARPMGGGGRSMSHAMAPRSYSAHTHMTATRHASAYGQARSTHRAVATTPHTHALAVAGAAAGAAAVAGHGAAAHAGAGHATTSHPELNRNVRAAHAFHAGAYNAPAGYVQRHWSYGERLPGDYYARNYWLTDFALYGLFGPPPGLVWVRVGPDALLIDQFSGEIVQVDYGVFY